MEKQNKQKLKDYLLSQPATYGSHLGRILCYDQVDDRRIDIDFIVYDNEVFINGDDGEKYNFSELELIDDRILPPLKDKQN